MLAYKEGKVAHAHLGEMEAEVLVMMRVVLVVVRRMKFCLSRTLTAQGDCWTQKPPEDLSILLGSRAEHWRNVTPSQRIVRKRKVKKQKQRCVASAVLLRSKPQAGVDPCCLVSAVSPLASSVPEDVRWGVLSEGVPFARCLPIYV